MLAGPVFYFLFNAIIIGALVQSSRTPAFQTMRQLVGLGRDPNYPIAILIFLGVVGAPVLRRVEPPALRQRLFHELGLRFRTVGWWAVAVLVVLVLVDVLVLRAGVAGVAHVVAVGVQLVGVRQEGAVVAGIADAVGLPVPLPSRSS